MTTIADQLAEALQQLEEAARMVQAGEMPASSIDLDRRVARVVLAAYRQSTTPAQAPAHLLDIANDIEKSRKAPAQAAAHCESCSSHVECAVEGCKRPAQAADLVAVGRKVIVDALAIITRYRESGIKIDADLVTAQKLGMALAATHPSEPAATERVTDAMVDAYLKANDAYWRETDELPKAPGEWRNGTPREATKVSLAAALAAAPRPSERVGMTEEQIHALEWPEVEGFDTEGCNLNPASVVAFVRAIEAAHRIPPPTGDDHAD